jgi:hypothetical protein
MAKTRVGVLFRESVGGKKSMNKSVDLQKYVAKYYEFCKQLAAMIAALKAHHQSMVKYEETQTQVRNWNHYSSACLRSCPSLNSHSGLHRF